MHDTAQTPSAPLQSRSVQFRPNTRVIWETDGWFEELPVNRMLEFHLIYQGALRANGDAKHKHAIRRYFHRQLMNAWGTLYPLKGRSVIEFPAIVFGEQENTREQLIQVGVAGKRFLPIVRCDLALICKLDILLLGDRRIVLQHTDIDNKIKTLLDALQIPAANQFCDGPEDPLYCLLENDSLVSELRVAVDYLLCPPDQVIASPKISEYTDEPTASPSHVMALIAVAVKPTKVMVGNMDFL